MDRRARIGALVGALCGAAAVAALVLLLAVWGQRPRLAYTQGSTVINNARLGRTGQRFPARAALVTGDDSTCAVEFGRRAVLSLGPNTVADLDLGASPPRVALRSGSVACVANGTGDSSQDTREFVAVRTESCLVEAADGAFYVRVEDEPIGPVCICGASPDPRATYVYARAGVLRVTDSAGMARQVDAARYSSFRFGVWKGQPAVSSTGLEYDAREAVDLVAFRAGLQIRQRDGVER